MSGVISGVAGWLERVLDRIAADLTNMFPAISRCALSMAGVLFDLADLPARQQRAAFSPG